MIVHEAGVVLTMIDHLRRCGSPDIRMDDITHGNGTLLLAHLRSARSSTFCAPFAHCGAALLVGSFGGALSPLLFALSSASAPLLHLTPFVNSSTCQIRLRRKTLSVFTASPEVPPITAVLRNCALCNQAPPQRSKEALTQHIETPNAASSTFQNPHFFCDLWCSPPGCYCLLCSSSCELQRAVRLPFRSVPIS